LTRNLSAHPYHHCQAIPWQSTRWRWRWRRITAGWGRGRLLFSFSSYCGLKDRKSLCIEHSRGSKHLWVLVSSPESQRFNSGVGRDFSLWYSLVLVFFGVSWSAVSFHISIYHCSWDTVFYQTVFCAKQTHVRWNWNFFCRELETDKGSYLACG
jgi:hypothetical protein